MSNIKDQQEKVKLSSPRRDESIAPRQVAQLNSWRTPQAQPVKRMKS